jgi:hypothetical protein
VNPTAAATVVTSAAAAGGAAPPPEDPPADESLPPGAGSFGASAPPVWLPEPAAGSAGLAAAGPLAPPPAATLSTTGWPEFPLLVLGFALGDAPSLPVPCNPFLPAFGLFI